MTKRRAGGGGDAARRAARRRRRARRILGWLSIALSAMLVASSLTAYAAYRKLLGNITHVDAVSKLGNHRPSKPTKSENILLLGSDTRQGQGDKEYGPHIEGARSDTVILLHLSPRRRRALLVSFPRDSWVDIPSCQQPNGSMSQPTTTRLNAAFSLGGPACTWKTLEQDTKIHIDHFVQVDFSGFKRMVDALGGVRVCLPVAVHDPKSGLDLSAGRHVVTGDQALAFVRVRHNIGNGSDLQRIERQQEFMASVVKRATSTRLLLDPRRLYDFLDVATKSVTTDNGLTFDDLRHLAESLRGLHPKNVTFMTVPVQTRPDGATVEWQQPRAGRLFDAIRNDHHVKKHHSPSARPSVPASEVRVRVLNGTTIPGLAGHTAHELRKAGFHVTHVGNASSQDHADTVIKYDPSAKPEADTLAKAAPFAARTPDQSLGRAVVLVLGPDAEGASIAGGGPGAHPSKTPTPLPTGLGGITANQNPCKTGALTRSSPG